MASFIPFLPSPPLSQQCACGEWLVLEMEFDAQKCADCMCDEALHQSAQQELRRIHLDAVRRHFPHLTSVGQTPRDRRSA